MQIVPGLIIGDKYEIERPLARGGMGSVWVARHVKLGSTVAIKVLDADIAAASGAIARFEREARAAANLDTPHVVRVHDYGVEAGTPYLVMELLRGEDLNTRLRKRRRLSLAEAAKIVSQMGRALRRAHEAGIVHRDLKPANVFLATVEDDEVVKILDFGIAKDAWSRVEDSTKTGEVFGSPHYMSPEQSRAQKTVDQRADVWATGVILYRMITGHLPFPGEVLGEILSSVLVDPVPPVAETAPDLPAELDTFFAKALAKKKEERFSSIDDLVLAFNTLTASTADRPPSTDAPGTEGRSAPTPARPAPAGPRPPPRPPAPRPPPPPSAAHEGTFATTPGPGTVDTGAATLPYRPSAPAAEQPSSPAAERFSSAGTETRTSAGSTGPSIATATNTLLPPELASRRPRVLVAVVALASSAVLVVILLLVNALSSEPASPAAAPEESAAATSMTASPVRVEPQRPAEPAVPSSTAAAPTTGPAPSRPTAATSAAATAAGKGSAATPATPAPTGPKAVKTSAAPTGSPPKKPPAPDKQWGL